jgi:vitamin B12 transporter
MVFLFLYLFLLLPTWSMAADSPQDATLAPVIVTATRTETPQQDVTTSISVITADDIRKEGTETVLDALRSVPGIDVVQNGSRGTTTSVFIRGANPNQVLVLIDGVEVNSVTIGDFDFAHLLTDNVDRIEVLRGSGGALYGSKAIGGVINIITKKGQGAPQVTLSTEGGNGATHREVLGVSGGHGPLAYSFSGSYLGTDGFRSVNDNYRNGAVSTRLDYQLIDNGSLKAFFNMTDTNLGLVNNNVSFGLVDPNAREKDQHLTGKLEWEHKVLPQWDYRLSFGITHSHELFTDPDPVLSSLPSRTLIKPWIFSPQFQTNYRLESGHQITFGIDLDLRSAKFTSTDGSGVLTTFDKSQKNQALYLQDQYKLLNNKLILVGGVRYDHNQDFGSELSPSFSAAYLINEQGTKLKANYSKGFRAPTFDDLFFPGFSNPNLKPEISWEINAGVEQRFGSDRVSLETNYFHREVRDLIVFKGFAPENVGQVLFNGTEVILRGNLGHGLSLGGNYTFLGFTDRLVRRPKHSGSVGLNYQNGPLNINLASHIVGRHLDFDAVTFNTIDKGGYSRFDLATSYTLPWTAPLVKQVSLFGKIQNLADKKYQEADGFRAPPLNFLIGLRGVFGSK